MLQLFIFLHTFREDQCSSERSSVEIDVEDSQEVVLPEGPVYCNVGNRKQPIFRMPDNPKSNQVLEHNEHIGYTPINLDARQISQISNNPAGYTALGAGANATRNKPAKSSAPGSVICWTTVDSNISNCLLFVCTDS